MSWFTDFLDFLLAKFQALNTKGKFGLVFLIVCLGALIFATCCYSVPVVPKVDDTGTVADAQKSADALDHVQPKNPADQPVINSASRALDNCAGVLALRDKQVNECSADLAECGKRYAAIDKAYSDYKSEHGIFASLKSGFHWFLIGAAAGAILALFGPTILSFLWAAVKTAAKIP